jgi:hypothetical protein
MGLGTKVRKESEKCIIFHGKALSLHTKYDVKGKSNGQTHDSLDTESRTLRKRKGSGETRHQRRP